MSKLDLHICIAAGIYPPDIGGPATYASKLKDMLEADGYTVIALAYTDNKTGWKDDVFRISRRLPTPLRYLRYILALLKYAKQSDIIYAQGPVSEGIPAWIASKLLRKPLVVKVVGDYAWEQGRQRYGIASGIDAFQQEPVRGMVRVFRWFQQRTVRAAAHVITPSTYLRRLVQGWGVDPDCITVVHNAVHIPEHTEQVDRVKHRLLTVARLVPWKGIAMLVDVVAKLRDVIPDITLRIVGDGTEYERLAKQIASHKAAEYITLLGKRSHEDVLAEMQQASVFLLNTSYEGLSHVLIEAQMLGLPTITTPAGGNTDIIVDRQNGRLVPFGDTNAWTQVIQDVLLDGAWRTSCSEQAVHMSEKKFVYDTMYRETVTILMQYANTQC